MLNKVPGYFEFMYSDVKGTSLDCLTSEIASFVP